MKIAFMTCPSREQYADYMRERIPEAEVFFDREKNATKNYLNMLSSAGKDSGLFMEDDIIVPDGFLEKAQKIIDQRSGFIINFFSRRSKDLTHGARFEAGANFNYNCCVYFPKGYAQSIVNYYDEWPRRVKELNGHGYDYLIADWLTKCNLPYWLHVPSLVQHREGISSIDPRRARSRQSKTFQDESK